MIEWLGTPVYSPPPYVHRLGALDAARAGPRACACRAILLGEEVTDRIQREMVGDESVQPLVRMVNRIHILEEARHIGFARAEAARTAAGLLAPSAYHRGLLARVAYIVGLSRQSGGLPLGRPGPGGRSAGRPGQPAFRA